ncbi:ABC transporter permease [Bacillus cereus VD196]|uniref:ABC transporter permease n=1 Tax=Bacillus cereus VD196 TaxID=1053243 RepID=A0A9W5PXN5_BACCE|nr:ABC transporter permease [Bacillus cereus]EOO57804.1 ABC transporter permease [Bacillus cereus VD196]
MLFKLSMSGLKSKLKDYIVLFVGLVMSISIFYMFQTLALNKAFIESNSVINSIGFVFQAGSFLLAILTFFYILYANSFLLSLRQKEFGMYMMLGAKRYKVTLLMFIETIILGTASLTIGIAVGVGLAEGIGQVLMTQLEFAGDGYKAFYIPSMTVTCIFFFGLFVLSAIMNSIKLSRISVLQLVHADTQTERVVVKGKMTGVVAFLAIILLGTGYASMIYMDKLREKGIFIALIATTAGTYMLFGSLLPFIIKKLKSNKKRSEKGLNAFTFAQLNFRINSLTKVLATVAMLIALGAGAISGGMAFKNNVPMYADQKVIYDVVIHNPISEEKKILSSITFKEKNEYRYKVDDIFIYYLKEDLEKNRPLIRFSNEMGDSGITKRISEELPAGAISLDSLEKTEHAVAMPEKWNTFLREIHPPYFDPSRSIKIVDRTIYDSIKKKEEITLIGKSDDFVTYTKEWKKIDELQMSKYKNKIANLTNDLLSSKYKMYYTFYTIASGTIFMGFFLGLAFLAMMASCLMFKILSSATKDITRYQMLYKIGVNRELLIRSIYKELFFVFLFPTLIGIAHVLFGMNIFSFILIDPYFRISVPILIFIVIYVIYYLVTVKLYKEIVLPKEN